MVCVTEINTIADLAGYRLLWNDLLRQTRGASFFHTVDWLESYWKHFGEGQRLRILVVHAAGRPIGILPLCVRTEHYKVGKLRVLTYPLHDWGTFYGPIGGNPTATLLAGLRHVRAADRAWDLLDLRWTDAESVDRGRTPQTMQQVGFDPVERPWAVTTVINFGGTWDGYLAERPAKWRQNCHREARRLAEYGTVRHIRYRPRGAALGDGDPRWDLYEQCLEVARRSWQGRSRTGTTLTHAAVRPFLRDAHAAAARCGMLDLNLLSVAGQPVAFNYGYQSSGSLYGLRMGYDPALAHLGCGNVLLARLIRDSFARGDHRLELGAGSLATKRHFGTHRQTCYRYTYYRPARLRTQLLRLKSWLLPAGAAGKGERGPSGP